MISSSRNQKRSVQVSECMLIHDYESRLSHKHKGLKSQLAAPPLTDRSLSLLSLLKEEEDEEDQGHQAEAALEF